MTAVTLLRFLAGRRDAILQIARTPAAVCLGALFVLSAGFAREYDAKDLSHEPWHLAIPLAASLATSFGLFGLVCAAARPRGLSGRWFFQTYPAFLALYWMTAPLAWLYALPVERFLSPADAARANIALLGIVSAWRVALMVRVLAVLFNTSWRSTVWVVMLFATTLVLLLLYLAGLPIIDIMGGIERTEAEEVVNNVATWACFLSLITWPLWLAGVCHLAIFASRQWHWAAEPVRSGSVQPHLWAVGLASVLIWAGVLPFTQPQQRIGRQVEELMAGRRIEEAVGLMSAHSRHDFPPHWEPPLPSRRHPDQAPELDVLEVLARVSAADWVRAAFIEQLELELRVSHSPPDAAFPAETGELDRLLAVLESLPEGREIVRRNARYFRNLLDMSQETSQEEDPMLRARIQALLDAAAPPAADSLKIPPSLSGLQTEGE
ncbi:MAG: hypothetical protein WD847_06110 [Pirellulales bacterium]